MKVAVGMSGGVDSAVAAGLLVEQGHEVLGVSIQTGYSTSSRCCSEEDLIDAKCTANKLGIRHEVIDLSTLFEKKIVQPFINCYASGSTPSPCPECNSEIKFEALLKVLKDKFDIEKLATGHYAQLEFSPENKRYQLTRAQDLSRDQSYMLYTLTQAHLSSALFPLGTYSKTAVRHYAHQQNMNLVSNKPDSQDLCFIGKSLSDFWQNQHPEYLKEGEIVSTTGQKLGTHQGIVNYTIGQRKGLGIAAPEPLYVTVIDANKNQLIVAPKEHTYSKSCLISQVNWVSIAKPANPMKVLVKIRYRSPLVQAILIPQKTQVKLEFAQSEGAVTPGQAAVFYNSQGLLLGGGTITSTKF